MPNRKAYPSDVSDEEWAFAAPYLTLVLEDSPQRNHELREVLNGVRWVVRTFEEMVHDLRVLLRLSEGRTQKPRVAILDSRTLRSTPESGSRGGYDGAKRKKGSKVHATVDTLGHLLALFVTPASEQERAWVGELDDTQNGKKN
jgi:hypothetical protein